MEAENKTPSEYAKRIIAEFMQDGQFHTTQEIIEYTKSNAPEGIEITEKHIGAVLYRETEKGRLSRLERGTYQWNAEFTGEKKTSSLPEVNTTEYYKLMEKLVEARRMLQQPLKVWELSVEELQVIPKMANVIRELQQIEKELQRAHRAKP